jgi:hypothetical protein
LITGGGGGNEYQFHNSQNKKKQLNFIRKLQILLQTNLKNTSKAMCCGEKVFMNLDMRVKDQTSNFTKSDDAQTLNLTKSDERLDLKSHKKCLDVRP